MVPALQGPHLRRPCCWDPMKAQNWGLLQPAFWAAAPNSAEFTGLRDPQSEVQLFSIKRMQLRGMQYRSRAPSLMGP